MCHEQHFSKSWCLLDEDATILFGKRFAQAVQTLALFQPGLVVYLQGNLGMGKTCLSRAFIQTFLPNQRVKSPTYTLIEAYPAQGVTIYHLDLYRLAEPEELAYLGVRDLLSAPHLLLVEWPNKAQGFLPSADILLCIEPSGSGRVLTLTALSAHAKTLGSVLSTCCAEVDGARHSETNLA
ncbi:tRNA (adenosine(37)-N6)-threonylcarbamoyltransferase complex ATPase subunit type 1 TsaE [Thiomicrospira microaerophila]|uniref:tRNA (adenosine(37)-N6)-threonylcarbamoyltransferase complex ATPase subunit type 1 TsaE n=1 Tax=Thiomicrospira microaerophila TaxID=406020 RepID=UPI0005C8B288|nr:tRNA (adenosine(37)-N6)-threonylcarbamoyltransferase complex ATPase subunit type 1 TsaE [Thiomicrospira microaerophila]